MGVQDAAGVFDSTCEEAELLTSEQAAAQLGRTLNSIRRYVREGLLSPAGFEHGTRVPLFLASDVARLHAEYCTRVSTPPIPEDGEKQCSVCGKIKPVKDNFARSARAACGYASECRACHGEQNARWREANPDKVRAAHYRSLARHRQRSHKYRQAIFADPMRAQEYRARKQRLSRIRLCLADAKTSPIHRRVGFSLVVNCDGVYRAARLDRPLPYGERGIAHYRYTDFGAAGFHWVASPPPVRSADPDLLDLLLNRCRRELRPVYAIADALPGPGRPRKGVSV